jgi:hypothetical protein
MDFGTTSQKSTPADVFRPGYRSMVASQQPGRVAADGGPALIPGDPTNDAFALTRVN